MMMNYLKTTFRSLLREKGNTIINIAGLTLGITGSLILFLIISEGSSYDNYHSKRDRIYRVVSKANGNTGENFTQGVPAVLPEAFKNDFRQAEEVAFTSYRRGSMITVLRPGGEIKKYEEPKGTAFTQPSFFKIFDRKILIGSAEKGLDEPNEAIISSKWALKYFGKEDVIGESIKYDNAEYKITAVMEDYPSNTDLPFDLMLSFATIKPGIDKNGWGNNSDSDNCYFLLGKNERITSIEAQMPSFVRKYFGAGDENPSNKTFLIQPLSEIHSDMRFGNYNRKMPKPAYIGFSIIGVFLLITACINFINLTTAEAIKRTREVGIRKVLGSTRKQLVLKFLNETFFITGIAALISVACTQVLLSFVNSFMDLSLALHLNSDFTVWLFLGVVTIVISALSGLYPAISISGFKPALALKNQISIKSSSGRTMRRGLVVVQFFISQFFIIGTIVITRQMDFMQNQDLGFAKEAIVTIPVPGSGDANRSVKIHTLKNEIMRLKGVQNASLNSTPPSARSVTGTTFKVAGNQDELDTQVKQVDGNYIDLFALKIVAGEQLTDADSVDGFVVNEKLVKMAGFTSNEEIIGKEMSLWGKNLPVRGVVKDFNTQSLSHALEPVVLLNNVNDYNNLSIKINPKDMQSTIRDVQTKWEAAYPEYIFKYEFLDEEVRGLYNGERRLSSLLTVFSSIAIFIGCLGLFGLVTFMANQRTKEIGVRKVLGASVGSIMILFSKEFGKLILIGFAFAAPAAGFLMNMLLEEFAYKIKLGPMIFLTGIGVTFLIAFLTVGYRSFSAATVNPVNSLRSE